MEKKVRKAIITDAGFASRYLPITKTVPKGMLPLGNKPIMQYVVEECVEAGIEEIIIVATPEGKPIYEDYFNNSVNKIKKQLTVMGKVERYEPVQAVLDFPKIVVITQDETLPYGNGSPVVSAQKFLEGEDAFLVLYSDDVIFGKFGDSKLMVDLYKENPGIDGVIMAQEIEAEEVDHYGIISFKKGSETDLDNIIEKPEIGTEPSRLASYGRYLLTAKIFDYLISSNTGKDNELWTVDAITKVAKKGRVLVGKSEATWLTTGDPENYFKAHMRFVYDYEKFGNKLQFWLDEFKK
ncbi:MAG: NTP transferase domain-containing protein [Pseudomonadales bacterium]|nr:NTP transferase domain-containing protein [Pseudomonadales bacterium]